MLIMSCCTPSLLSLKGCLLYLSLLAPPTVNAQDIGKHGADYTYAEGSHTYWRNMHSTRSNNYVFRRDPNIWVYTTDVAKRAGMPLEWASDELKGVAAAAFRMERNGAEEDCGWGRNPKACKPVVQCVLELYFDRQAHPLPWDMRMQVADFDWQKISTAFHFLPAQGWAPTESGDRSRGSLKSPHYPTLGSHQPFTDPQTGEELTFEPGSDDPGGTRLGGHKVIAYDREIHSRYAFVRLAKSCTDAERANPKGSTLELGTRNKVVYKIFFPGMWTQRLIAIGEKSKQGDTDFYKSIWRDINQKQ